MIHNNNSSIVRKQKETAEGISEVRKENKQSACRQDINPALILHSRYSQKFVQADMHRAATLPTCVNLQLALAPQTAFDLKEFQSPPEEKQKQTREADQAGSTP